MLKDFPGVDGLAASRFTTTGTPVAAIGSSIGVQHMMMVRPIPAAL